MQQIYDKARELYPDWDPNQMPKVISGLSEMDVFIPILNEVFKETTWTPIDDFDSDPMFRTDLRSVIVSSGFKPKLNARIYSMTISSLFFKPHEVMPETGSYILPQIIPIRSFNLTRALIQTFDIKALHDLKSSGLAILPKNMVAGVTKLDRDAWKSLIMSKYFGNIQDQIDQILDGIYDMKPSEQPTLELLGKVMIRIHKDDFTYTEGMPEYFISKPIEQ